MTIDLDKAVREAARDDLLVEITLLLYTNSSDGGRLLQIAIKEGDVNLIESLLDAGVDPNIQNSSGETPLHWAVSFGHANIVDILLGRGTESEVRDKSGRTAIDLIKKTSPLYGTSTWRRLQNAAFCMDE
jgi:ankyrin repeat protein